MSNERNLEYLMNSHYGPDNDMNINWSWSYRIVIPPKKHVEYRFSFKAWFENAAIVYDLSDSMKKLVERGNHSRTSDNYDFVNNTDKEVEHIITGWHKPSPPKAKNDWLHSPNFVHTVKNNIFSVGFADDQNREPNPDTFINAFVSCVFL